MGYNTCNASEETHMAKLNIKQWSPFKKNLLLLLCVVVLGCLISIPFLFLDNPGVLIGWVLGSLVNLFAYATIAGGAKFLLENDKSGKSGYLALGFGAIRFLLYGGVLLLAAFASFRWGTLDHSYCNIIAAALALMPNWVVLVITTFIGSKSQPAPAKKDETEGKE